MHKIKILLITILLTMLSSSLFAYEKAVYTNTLSILFLGSLNGTYEFQMKDNTTLALSGNIQKYKSGDWDLTFLGAQCAYHIYPQENILEDFFWGPYIGFSSISADYKDKNTDLVSLAIGAECGYKWILDSNIILGVLVAAGINTGKIKIGDQEYDYSGVGLHRISFDVGYTW